jgi:hypothetical protein
VLLGSDVSLSVCLLGARCSLSGFNLRRRDVPQRPSTSLSLAPYDDLPVTMRLVSCTRELHFTRPASFVLGEPWRLPEQRVPVLVAIALGATARPRRHRQNLGPS